MPMYSPDRDSQVNANSKCGQASEQSGEDQQPAKEFREGGDVTPTTLVYPNWPPCVLIKQMAQSVLVSMGQHDNAKGKAHNQQRERAAVGDRDNANFPSSTDVTDHSTVPAEEK